MAVVTVAFEDLDTWLQNQPANTADTPYELNITGLTANDIRSAGFSGTLGYILQQNYTKYVDLRSTVLPNGVTDLSNAFSRSTSFMLEGKNSPIVYAPEIPTGVTSMASCFSMCNSLISSPTIPNGVTRIDNCFQACNSLIIAPNIPSSVVNMYRCFYQCTSLTTWKQSDVITTTNLNFNSVFFRCTNLVNIQSDRPYEIKNFLNTLYSAGTGNFPNDPDTCNFSLLNEPAEIPFSLLNNELSALSANTPQTPYKLNVTELTANDLGQSSTSGTLGYVLTQNDTKYVDLSSTEIPNTVVELRATFKNCTSLVQVFDIPSSVTNMSSCFYRCTSLISAPIIPNSVTYMSSCFFDCSSLSTIPNIPNYVTEMSSCFYRCTSLTTAPEIRSSRNMENCFYGCTSLTTAPVIFSAISMGNCFRECTSLITVPIIPNSVTYIRNCFYGCSALEEITLCEADLESLVNNNKAENCFYGCTSLTKIGLPPTPDSDPTESDWHAFRLKFDATTVQGKVYDKTGTAVTIPQTTVTKSTLKLPIKTDELWFPSGYTDAQIDEIIQKVIQYRYTYWNDNDVLDPAEKNFVLWADDPNNVKTNLVPDIDYPIPVDKGGTGKTTAQDACNDFINALSTGTSTPTDNDYYVSQYAEGGTTHTTYHRRPVSALWNYIKGKLGNIIKAISANGFWGMADPNGADNVWIRTTSQGLIPYQSGGYNAGHQLIGTSSWYFQNVYSQAFTAGSSGVVSAGEYSSTQGNSSSWWLNKNPRGKFYGTDGGTASGWSPLLAGKTVAGKYEFGSLNNTVYLNYYKDGRTTNGIDKTIFDYTQDGTANWYGTATTANHVPTSQPDSANGAIWVV